jgi:hypothetical protein
VWDLNEKERYIRMMSFQSVDKVPNFEIGTWEQTALRWYNEGLPMEVDPNSLFMGNEYFEIDGIDVVGIDALLPYPPEEERTLEENDRYVVFSDQYKRIRKALKTGTVGHTRLSMDQYISFPVVDRDSYEEYRKGYTGNVEKRYPEDWNEIKKKAALSTRPLHLLDPMEGTFGFYSMLRNWMGTQGLSYMFYDDKALILECIEFLCDFEIHLMDKALTEIKFDFYWIHEDMCFNTGPLVSPEIFKKVFMPSYRRFISFLKSKGVSIILVDTDGNFEKLIPDFLEAGVDGFGPMEIAAGMDPVKMRKKYGNTFCMSGGIDKREIAKGKREIEEELKIRVIPIIDKGGFIPSIDHSIPPSISLDNFCYYMELKQKILKG